MTKSNLNILYLSDSAYHKTALLELSEFAGCFGLTEKRDIEKKAALFLVRQVLQNEALEIMYAESGKPLLLNGVKISISHAYEKLAVLFSFNDREVGIDIEKVRDKILKIKEKFLSPHELQELKEAPLEKYTLYWAAKEAIYKAHGKEGLLFAEQIAIKPFSGIEKVGKIQASVNRHGSEKKYTLHYQVLNDYVLVYTDNTRE